jgi:hypothetical protein
MTTLLLGCDAHHTETDKWLEKLDATVARTNPLRELSPHDLSAIFSKRGH